MIWPTVALGELCEINVGKTPSRANKSYWTNGTEPWLSIADMTKGFLVTQTKEFITKEAAKSCNCKLAATGTVLMSFKLSVGKVSLATFPLYTNEAIAALPVKNKSLLCEEYLVHALKSIDLYLGTDRAAMGLTLNKDKLKRIPIPLPPLAEQKRIAAILDKAAEIKTKREQAIAKLDELAQSTFVAMFGVDASPVKSLVELGRVKTGGTPPSSMNDMYGDEIPFVTPGDLGRDSRVKRYLTMKGALESVTVNAGSSMVCCIGATIGKMDIAKEKSAFNQQINAVEWNDEIADIYGFYALKSIKSDIIKNASSTTLPILKKSLFEKLKIKVPSISKQHDFAKRIARNEQLAAIQKNALTRAEMLYASLQHQAFTTGFDA